MIFFFTELSRSGHLLKLICSTALAELVSLAKFKIKHIFPNPHKFVKNVKNAFYKTSIAPYQIISK